MKIILGPGNKLNRLTFSIPLLLAAARFTLDILFPFERQLRMSFENYALVNQIKGVLLILAFGSSLALTICGLVFLAQRPVDQNTKARNRWTMFFGAVPIIYLVITILIGTFFIGFH